MRTGNHGGVLIDMQLRHRFGAQRGEFALIERRGNGADDAQIAGHDAARPRHRIARRSALADCTM